MVVLVTSLIFITYNLQKGILLKRAIAQRENIFKKSKGKTVHVKLINQELSSPCYHFSDFFIAIPDENNYVKTTQELFFDVKIIIEK